MYKSARLKKQKCCCHRRFKLQCFEEGRRRKEDAGIEEEILQKISYCFFFFPETRLRFFFFLFFFVSPRRSRVLREVQMFPGRWTFSNHALHSWTRGFVPLPSTPPNSPTRFCHLTSYRWRVPRQFCSHFKNTDDKTHRYTTGGWEGC